MTAPITFTTTRTVEQRAALRTVIFGDGSTVVDAADATDADLSAALKSLPPERAGAIAEAVGLGVSSLERMRIEAHVRVDFVEKIRELAADRDALRAKLEAAEAKLANYTSTDGEAYQRLQRAWGHLSRMGEPRRTVDFIDEAVGRAVDRVAALERERDDLRERLRESTEPVIVPDLATQVEIDTLKCDLRMAGDRLQAAEVERDGWENAAKEWEANHAEAVEQRDTAIAQRREVERLSVEAVEKAERERDAAKALLNDVRWCKCNQPWLPAVGLYGTTEETRCQACVLREMLADLRATVARLTAEGEIMRPVVEMAVTYQRRAMTPSLFKPEEVLLARAKLFEECHKYGAASRSARQPADASDAIREVVGAAVWWRTQNISVPLDRIQDGALWNLAWKIDKHWDRLDDYIGCRDCSGTGSQLADAGEGE
jgi:hypothetical protein